MTTLLQALLFGTITGISAWLAHRAFAAFHDGVRPFIRHVHAGEMERAEAAQSTWQMSYGFVAYYGAPFTLVTGVMEKHILGLTADWIGVRSQSALRAVAGGFCWGVLAALVVAGVQFVFGHLPRPIGQDLLLVGVPLIYMLPLIPVVAISSQFGVRAGLVNGVIVAVVFVATAYVFGRPIEGVPFVVGALALIFLVARERADPVPDVPEEFVAGSRDVRRGTAPLVVNGGLLALGASLLWLAGEPASVMLVGLHRPVDAALIGLLSWIGFIPLVTLTSVTSGAYVSAGVPDGILALGLLSSRFPPLAVVVGALAMGGEVWGLGRLERLLAAFPGLHGAGAAIRDGLLLTSEIALLLGGAISANTMWPGYGIFVVAGFWLLNEAFGTRVMRVAVGPIAAIVTGLAVNALVIAHASVPSLVLR